METVVGAVAEQERLLVVRALVEVVAQFVVDRGEVVGIDLDAHLHAQVVDASMSQARGMADYFTVARMHELRALPERFRQRRKSQRLEKVLPIADHGPACGERCGVALVGAQVGAFGERGRSGGIFLRNLLLERGFKIDRLELRKLRIGGRDEVVDVAPLLRPHVAQQLRRDHAVGALARPCRILRSAGCARNACSSR